MEVNVKEEIGSRKICQGSVVIILREDSKGAAHMIKKMNWLALHEAESVRASGYLFS